MSIKEIIAVCGRRGCGGNTFILPWSCLKCKTPGHYNHIFKFSFPGKSRTELKALVLGIKTQSVVPLLDILKCNCAVCGTEYTAPLEQDEIDNMTWLCADCGVDATPKVGRGKVPYLKFKKVKV